MIRLKSTLVTVATVIALCIVVATMAQSQSIVGWIVGGAVFFSVLSLSYMWQQKRRNA